MLHPLSSWLFGTLHRASIIRAGLKRTFDNNHKYRAIEYHSFISNAANARGAVSDSRRTSSTTFETTYAAAAKRTSLP